MLAKILISPSLDTRVEEINKILSEEGLKNPHPDLLYFPAESKLGITDARKIKQHFSLKPYSTKGRAVVLEDASNLTTEAQNALLKTLEEPPTNALLILAAPSDNKFLPTILSRCQIIRLQVTGDRLQGKNYSEDIEKLIKSDIGERFEYIEKLKDRPEFLKALISYFHNNLRSHMSSGNSNHVDFLKELLKTEDMAKQNVNIRAILEYLMLKMPKVKP